MQARSKGQTDDDYRGIALSCFKAFDMQSLPKEILSLATQIARSRKTSDGALYLPNRAHANANAAHLAGRCLAACRDSGYNRTSKP